MGGFNGYNSTEPCEICGKTGGNKSEPRFGYTVCEEHSHMSPVEITVELNTIRLKAEHDKALSQALRRACAAEAKCNLYKDGLARIEHLMPTTVVGAIMVRDTIRIIKKKLRKLEERTDETTD